MNFVVYSGGLPEGRLWPDHEAIINSDLEIRAQGKGRAEAAKNAPEKISLFYHKKTLLHRLTIIECQNHGTLD